MEQGSKVNEFVLEDQDEKKINLKDFRGKKVLLSFHPLAWTSVCAKQMLSLEENKDQFAAQNTVALGISVDPVPSKKAWAESLGIDETRLLSDFWPHGRAAQQFGIFREEDGISERANFILNEEGVIIFKKIYEISKVPDIEEILSVLRQK